MDQIAALLDRPKVYSNIDGVGELTMGFWCLGWVLFLWLKFHTPIDSVWNQIYVLFIYVALMGAVIHHGGKAIKRHITYPRTGFVEYRRRDFFSRRMIIGSSLGVLVSVGFAMAFVWHKDGTAPASLIGLLLAASYARGFARSARWKWVVVWALVFGSLVIATLPEDLVSALAKGTWMTFVPLRSLPAKFVGAFLLFLMLYGTLLSTSGGISFWLYLRHTQPPAPEGR